MAAAHPAQTLPAAVSAVIVACAHTLHDGVFRPGPALAALLWLYLSWVSSWLMLAVGGLAILAALAYTGGPWPFGYHGLNNPMAFLFFGPVAVAGAYFAQAGRVTAAVWWMSAPVGLIITAILVVNNLRDIETDRAAGKRTLAVRFGAAAARREYFWCLAIAYAIPPSSSPGRLGAPSATTAAPSSTRPLRAPARSSRRIACCLPRDCG